MSTDPFVNVHRKASAIIWALARKVYADTHKYAIWIGRGWDYKSTEHSTGRALDIMVSAKVNTRPTATQKARGEKLAAYLVKHAKTMHIRHIIWNERIYRTRYKAWGPLPGRTAKSNNSDWHRDHIHVWLEDTAGSIPSETIILDSSSTAPAPQPAPAPAKPAPAPKPSTSSSTRTLKRGSVGDDVKRLQEGLLRVFPAYARRIRTNGGPNRNFGPATEATVREFQRRSSLKVDGIVGPATRSALARHGVKF